MSASITLNKTSKLTDKGTVQLVLTTVGTGISSKVFAVEVLPKSADSTAPAVRFSHVCSPSELIEFPADVPGDNCYYRTDSMTMIFDIAKTAELVVYHVQKDLQHLVDEYNKLEAATADTSSVVIS